jgi:2-oxoglutarate dehydrogenase complex dehydrogenase (E1) component-like enzyme
MSILKLLEAFGDKDAMEELKKDFRENFMATWKKMEQDYCNEKKVVPVMNEQYAGEIMKYLDQCPTPFHIEALKRMVLKDFYLPDDFQDLDKEAQALMTKALTE